MSSGNAARRATDVRWPTHPVVVIGNWVCPDSVERHRRPASTWSGDLPRIGAIAPGLPVYVPGGGDHPTGDEARREAVRATLRADAALAHQLR